MPPVQHVLPDHLLSDDEGAPDREEVAAAVAVLPAEEYERLLVEAVVTFRRCDDAGDYRPLRLFVASLFATSCLHRDPAYREAIRTALASEVTTVVDGDDFLEQIKGMTFPRT